MDTSSSAESRALNQSSSSRASRWLVLCAAVIAAAVGSPAAEAADFFHSLEPPCREYDTRDADGPALAGQEERTIQLTEGDCGVPDGATAVAINIATDQPSAGGNLFLGTWSDPGPGNDPPDKWIRINFNPNRPAQSIAAIVKLETDGTVKVRARTGVGETVHLILDISGYFTDDNPPVVTTSDGTTAFTEDGGPVVVDSGVTVSDADDTNLKSATVTITNPLDGLDEVLAATSCGALTVTPGTNSLSITGTQPLATYQTCLQSVTYDNTSQGPDTTDRVIAFVVNDGTSNSAPGNKNASVTPVNDAPAGTDNTVSTPEDTQYTFAVADFGYTDPLDDPDNALQSVVITTLPAAGSLTLSGSGFAAGTEIAVADITAGNLKFAPAAGATGSPYTSFTFQVRDDGGTANGGVDLDQTPNTMTINVTGVNNAPAGTDNTVSTPEDTQYTFTAADFGFTDPLDTPANAFQSVVITTLPAAGSLTLSGSGFAAGTEIAVADITAGNLKFAPAAGATGSPYTSFTFQVRDNGGTAGGGVDLDPTPNTMAINVTAVNDAPAGTDNTVTTPEDTQYTFAVADFGFTDPIDSPANALSAVRITTLPAAGSLTLSGSGFAAGTEVSVANITAGNLKFTPAANASGSPYTSFTFQVKDDGGTASGGIDLDPTPNTMTINVTAANDAPAGTDTTVTTPEDTQYTFTVANFGFTDANDTPANAFQSVVITTLPAAGSLTLSGAGFAAGTEVSVADITAGNLKFAPAAGATGSPYTSFTFQVRDDGGGVNLDPTPNTMSIDVTPVNDAPAGTDTTVTTPEDAQYTFTAANFGFTDANDTPANAFQSVVITTLPAAGSLTLSGSGFAAGTEVSVAAINAGNLKFAPAANATGSPYTSFTFQVRDDGGIANGGVDLDPTPNTMTINVTPVNDPPAGTDKTVTTPEDTQYIFTIADFGFTDPVDSPANAFQSVVITTLPAAGSLTLSGSGFAAGTEIPVASIVAGNLRFQGALNAFGSPYASFTFQVRDDGGTANGGVNLDPTPNTMTINVTPVNDAPLADNDTFDFIGNTELRVDLAAALTPHALETTGGAPFGVLDGDVDVEGDTLKVSSITVGGCTDNILPYPLTCTDVAVGTVQMEEDGRFSFVPAPGDVGASETFQYTVTDNGLPAAASTIASVTLTRFGRVWYVDNDTPTPGNAGTSVDPFDTLAEVQAPSGANDYIFVHFGDGTTADMAAGLSLKAGQHLIGEHVGLLVPFDLNGNGAPTTLFADPPGDRRPLLDDTVAGGPEGVSAIDVVPVEIVGLSLAGNVNAIEWTTNAAFNAGSASFSIRDNVIRGAGGDGVDINLAGTGTPALAFHDNTLTATGTALDIQETGAGSLTITAFDDNVVGAATGGTGINVLNARFDGTAGGSYQPVSGGTTLVGAPGDVVGGSGVVLSGITGDLQFTDLDIFAGDSAGDTGLAVTGTAPVDTAAGTGTRVTVGAGVGIIEATGGPAVNLSTVTADLQLSSLKSTNSTTTGVSLNNVADGTSNAIFSAGSGSSITTAAGASGPAFNVNGGNAAITYGGTITNNSTGARAVSITSWAGDDTVTPNDNLLLSGAIDENGAGILVNANGGSRSITFSGGMDIDTTAGEGFAATSNTNTGGLHITGTNTIDSVSATALRVTNTTIGNSNLNFQSISSGNNGAPADPVNGLVLNSTGTLGGLTVTGTGSTDGSGGVIQNTSSDAISLTTTRNINLNNMTIGDAAAVPAQAANATNNIGGHGINMSGVTNADLTNVKIARTASHGITGTDVTDLDITNGEILNAGDGNEEHGLNFSNLNQNNLDGTVNISGTIIDAFAEDGIFVENWSGTLNLNLNTVTIGRNANTLCGGVTCGENGIHIRADSLAVATRSTINVDVINSFFDDVDGNGIFVVAEGQGGLADVDINTTRIENATALGIVLFGGDLVGNPATLNFDITNNNGGDDGLFNINSNAISIQPNGSSTMTGTISNTRIQGSILGFGIDVPTDDDSKLVIAVDSNQISATECDGIRVLNGNTAELDAHIRGNSVAEPDDDQGNGICHGIEINVRETSETCLDISGNTSTGASPAVGFRTRQRDTSVFQLERFVGNGTVTGDIVSFLQSQNSPPAGQTASATVSTTYTGVANGACEDP